MIGLLVGCGYIDSVDLLVVIMTVVKVLVDFHERLNGDGNDSENDLNG